LYFLHAFASVFSAVSVDLVSVDLVSVDFLFGNCFPALPSCGVAGFLVSTAASLVFIFSSFSACLVSCSLVCTVSLAGVFTACAVAGVLFSAASGFFV
jgi:hypothetical protein